MCVSYPSAARGGADVPGPANPVKIIGLTKISGRRLTARTACQPNAHRIISHACGRDVLAAIGTLVPQRGLAEAHAVLQRCGNMSSPSVFFALERAMSQGSAPPFWLTSFGAGFTCHSCTLEG